MARYLLTGGAGFIGAAVARRLVDQGDEVVVLEGIQRINTYQLMMLMGTEMESGMSRRDFGIKTRWRVLPRSFGDYEGRKALEIEEVCVETSTLSFADYKAGP